MNLPVVDCHGHLYTRDDLDVLMAVADRVPLQRVTVLTLPRDRQANGLPLALWAKSRFPDRLFAFGAWNHAGGAGGGRPAPAVLAAQVREQAAAGVDGWKILESKPEIRRDIDEPLDGPYYTDGFAALEALDLPVLWHVADPAEFWDPARTPAWARARGWGYGPNHPSYESLYAEVDRVLARHPRLRIIFAHFLFLSGDLDRAARFLSAHPRVGFDLALGIELCYNLSRNRDAAREFFIRHADRIFFGTDSGLIRGAPEASVEARVRLVLRFLTTAETFRVPSDADCLLGPPEDGIIHGLDLPRPALERILAANQQAWAGARPKPLDRPAAAALCRRIAADLPATGADAPVVRDVADLSASLSPE